MLKIGEKINLPAVPTVLRKEDALNYPFYHEGGFYVLGGEKLKPITREQSVRLSTVYRCINVISDDIAALPLQIYQKQGDKRVRLPKNSSTRNAAFLVEMQPNRWQTPFVFKKLISQSLLLDGNAYVWQPISNYPERFLLDPRTVTPVLDSTGDRWFRWMAPNGKEVLLADPEVWHVLINPTGNGLLGRSVISYARETLARQWYSNESRGEILGNGLMPRALLQVNGALDNENRKLVKQKFLEAADDGVAVMDDRIVSFKPLSINPDDAQFLETSQAGDTEIANYFGVPEYKLNRGKQSYQSNEQQQLDYLGTTLNPYLIQIEQQSNLKWLTEVEAESCYHLFERRALLQITALARADYMAKMIASGLMSPNEGRQIEDMDRYEGGDQYFFAGNMAVITKDGLEMATKSGDGDGTSWIDKEIIK